MIATHMTEEIKAQIIDADSLKRTITRLAHEIVERNRGLENLVILGIRTRGVPIAKRIIERIQEIENITTFPSILNPISVV